MLLNASHCPANSNSWTYEARKAFEQYDAVDARNRLVADELERRWNEKLEEIETVKQRLSSLNGNRYSLSSEEEARIRFMGENFAELWQSDRCPPTLMKMIFRTVIEEIIVLHGYARRKRCNSRFTGRVALTRNWKWSGHAPQPKRQHPWRLWTSSAGWRFAVATIRLLLY